jgi:hypothetical protein
VLQTCELALCHFSPFLIQVHSSGRVFLLSDWLHGSCFVLLSCDYKLFLTSNFLL